MLARAKKVGKGSAETAPVAGQSTLQERRSKIVAKGGKLRPSRSG